MRLIHYQHQHSTCGITDTIISDKIKHTEAQTQQHQTHNYW